jgi:hypothetical protein
MGTDDPDVAGSRSREDPACPQAAKKKAIEQNWRENG